MLRHIDFGYIDYFEIARGLDLGVARPCFTSGTKPRLRLTYLVNYSAAADCLTMLKLNLLPSYTNCFPRVTGGLSKISQIIIFLLINYGQESRVPFDDCIYKTSC